MIKQNFMSPQNSEPLEDDPNIHLSLDGRELKLLQVREKDAGNYSCLAVNVAGAIFISHTLDVHGKPDNFQISSYVYLLVVFKL